MTMMDARLNAEQVAELKDDTQYWTNKVSFKPPHQCKRTNANPNQELYKSWAIGIRFVPGLGDTQGWDWAGCW